MFQRDLENFRRNPAWNCSAYLAISALNFFTHILFSVAQKEKLPDGHLLASTDERGSLPPNLMVPLMSPGIFVGDAPSNIYFLFAAHFIMRSIARIGKILLGQRGVDFRPFLTLQPDCFSTANLGVDAAEAHTSWLLSGLVRRCL